MASRPDQTPLIVIVGPTASGKTALAIELAQKYAGEIICADSRTLYEGMDIGTAKPTVEEQALVPHWGLDLVEPGEPFSAADFKRYALQKIDEIRARGHVPFLVGGTGLYVDGIVFDYQFGDTKNAKLRAKLEQKTIAELQVYCNESNIEMPENTQNKRYLIRVIEQLGINTTRQKTPIDHCTIVGIATDKELLLQRIFERSEHLFENGMVEEAKMLGKKYGWKSEAMTGNIYPLVKQFLDGKLTEQELKEKNRTADWRLAKRQITWFKRNAFIHWLSLDDARTFLVDSLSLN
jgi:tRNA dimethylallyltransferase